ncbi:MAG: HlyD family efflux transporter periplasmic adaptor subunit [Oscillochloris sp.]|nr:HlyD family efflux transporter periplasmic adaptor subunit [Oscillochloris sp.]
MKRQRSIFALTLITAGAFAISACSPTQPPEPSADLDRPAATAQAPATTSAPEPPVSPQQPASDGGIRLADGTVITNARVQPATVVELSFEIGGMIQEVMVRPGETVQAGDVLARLDTRRLELQVEEARAQLAEARANYERLVAGATPEQINRAEAEIDEAQARLAANQNNVTAEELAAARAELREANAVMARLKAGPRSEDIAVMQAAVDNAKARLQTRRDTLSAEKLRIESSIERVANELRNAQDYYSRLYWANQGKDNLDQADRDAEAQALRDVQNQEQRIEELKLALEEAQKNEISEIAAYEADVRQAEARLNIVLLPVDADQIAAAEKRILNARARIAELTGAEREFSIDALNAQVRQAEADYAALVADPTTSDLALAESRLLRAEVVLKQAELDVERVAVRTPISGTIATMSIEPGQVTQGGDVAFVVADLNTWQVITEDLNELSISRIREGDPATITFFALPDLSLPGTVSFIETIGRDEGVGTSYTVTVTPDQWDERLRWNMTAQVTFEPQP